VSDANRMAGRWSIKKHKKTTNVSAVQKKWGEELNITRKTAWPWDST